MEAYKSLEAEHRTSLASAADTEKRLSRKVKEMMEVQDLNQQVHVQCTCIYIC